MNSTTAIRLDFDNTSIAFKRLKNSELRKAYWLFSVIASKTFNSINASLTPTLTKALPPYRWLVKKTAFDHFCGGVTIADCNATIDALQTGQVGTILDYSVEGEGKEEDFDATYKELLKAITNAKDNPSIPFAVFKCTGIGPIDVLARVQAGIILSSIEAKAYSNFKSRLSALAQAAASAQVRLFIDAEETWIQKEIDALAISLMQVHNTERAIIWNTYQLYLQDSLSALKAQIVKAETGGFKLGAKLVRGAYMEKETREATKAGQPTPVQPTKAATDAAYDAAATHCLQKLETVSFCLGTHNEASSASLARQMQNLDIDSKDERVWFAQLLGMSDNLSFVLAQAGFNVAKYVPYGPVVSVIPYLIRRAHENTSVEGQTGRELALIEKEMNRRGMSRFGAIAI